MISVLSYFAALIIFILGVALLVGIIGFFVEWACEEDIKKTWPVKLFAKNYFEYYNEQNYTVTIWQKDKRYGNFVNYIEKKVKDFPTITFNQFKDFYSLNPESWSLKDCRVVKDNNDELSLTFTYQEWKKYKKFKDQVNEEKARQRERIANQKLEKEKVETTKKVLEAVQKDIDKIRADAKKEFEEVKNVVENASCKHEQCEYMLMQYPNGMFGRHRVCKKCGKTFDFNKEWLM